MIKDCFDDFVLVVGLARSGTSWLGKILDSDPAVVYRYEPDNLKKFDLFKDVSSEIQNNGCSQKAASLLNEAYKNTALLKDKVITGHSVPIDKSFRDVNLASISKLLPFLSNENVLKTMFRGRGVRFVAKTVEFDWGLEWISNALGNPKIVFIIRHPCANVNSYTSGKEYGMGSKDAASWAAVWLKLHENMGLPDAVPIPNFKLVVYEELCADPLGKTQEIFDFLNWDLTDSTKNFLKESTTKTKSNKGYWSVYKDPLEVANKWKTNLTQEEKDAVYRVLGDSKLMKYWKDE